jgi:hypothetical protein
MGLTMAEEWLVDPYPAAGRLSTFRVRSPLFERAKAVEQPTTPAPIIIASNLFIILEPKISVFLD